MKLLISLSAGKDSYAKTEEVYDVRNNKDVKIVVNMPRKKDYTKAITKLNGRMVVITYWAVPGM